MNNHTLALVFCNVNEYLRLIAASDDCHSCFKVEICNTDAPVYRENMYSYLDYPIM